MAFFRKLAIYSLAGSGGLAANRLYNQVVSEFGVVREDSAIPLLYYHGGHPRGPSSSYGVAVFLTQSHLVVRSARKNGTSMAFGIDEIIGVSTVPPSSTYNSGNMTTVTANSRITFDTTQGPVTLSSANAESQCAELVAAMRAHISQRGVEQPVAGPLADIYVAVLSGPVLFVENRSNSLARYVIVDFPKSAGTTGLFRGPEDNARIDDCPPGAVGRFPLTLNSDSPESTQCRIMWRDGSGGHVRFDHLALRF